MFFSYMYGFSCKFGLTCGFYDILLSVAEHWKYTSFVIFICYSQNIQRHSVMGDDYLVADVVENIGIEIPISNSISVLLFHAITRKRLRRINILFKIQMNVKHHIQ